MIEELLKDIRELRDEMVQQNWPAQRLSNIILKYEMKLQEDKHKYTTEELVKANLESFGRSDELRSLKIPNSKKLRDIHNSLIEVSELLISAGNALEDNAWLGGSVSFAERNLDTARVAFQKAVKVVYAIEDGKEIKPEMEYKEYEVGDKPDKFQFKQ